MAHDLTLNSAATFATSPISTFGQALQSGGSGVSAAALFSAAGTSLEIECVIEYAAAPSTNAIIAMQDYLFALAFTSAGKIQAWIGYVGGTNASITSPNTYADGKSHRVALIYSNATMLLLVDGAAVATAAVSSTVQAAMSWTKQVLASASIRAQANHTQMLASSMKWRSSLPLGTAAPIHRRPALTPAQNPVSSRCITSMEMELIPPPPLSQARSPALRAHRQGAPAHSF
ncbi:LamG-like jellyroll fold domain-containing protein [Acetobacter sacchari]|uniref:LamG-like jellyroll fold domain-containing protein n=1 Tax=Acetobacter sacchari TaxID=2661687 RepID=UPI001FAF54A9|nr:LamG-like jellyroll fold domain-containing protein [Acetobacter sacchari]